MFVNNTQVPLHWSSFASDQWMFVHLESRAPINDNVNFMSRVTDSSAAPVGCLKGRLAEIHMWGTRLERNQQLVVSQGFDQVRD